MATTEPDEPTRRSLKHLSKSSDRRRRGRLTRRIVGGVVIAVVLCIAWVGFRAVRVVSAMNQAQTQIAAFKTQATSFDTAHLAATAQKLSKATGTAASNANDPIWRAVEIVPVLGRNLRVVRQVVDASDTLAKQVVDPVTGALGTVDLKTLRTADGGLDLNQLTPLTKAMPAVARSYDSIAAQVSGIDAGGTFGPVSSAQKQLDTMLGGQRSTIDGLNKYLPLVMTALGANSPRNYVVVFPNEAETTGLGGSAASMLQLTVDHGALKVGRQASSSDFRWQDGHPIIPADPAVERIFQPLVYTRSNLALARPDFPTGARMINAYWTQYFGGHLDGVISMDPTALSYLMKVTGPVKLANGDTLTGANVVGELLNKVYLRYAKPTINETNAATNAYFAMATNAIFDKLTHTAANPGLLVRAVGHGVSERRIMIWFQNPDEQKQLDGTTIQGVLPKDNAKQTVTGVYFRDTSASKMDYYLKTSAALTTDVCTAKTPTFTTTIGLQSTISAEAMAHLPIYVAPQAGRLPYFTTHVAVYGPPGTKAGAVKVTVDGTVRPAAEVHVDSDLGRPVVWFDVSLYASKQATASVQFTGGAGDYGTPTLFTTPMLHPTAVSTSAPGCASRG